MTSADRLRAAIAEACGVPEVEVVDLTPTAGGDISLAHTAVVAGRPAFVKHLDPPVPGLLAAEADGLAWLTVEGGPRIPSVLGVRDEDGDDLAAARRPAGDLPEVLVLERLQRAAPAADHDERLGRGLAALHRAGAPTFGSRWPSFVGTLAQPRASSESDAPALDPGQSWDVEFLIRCRWWPAAAEADRRGNLPPGTLDALSALSAVAGDRLGPPEPPARVHGDLWAGNAITDEAGHPVLIDPSAHGGLREADLAMMKLFGGFGPGVFAAYDEAFPLADGHADRVALHQLHPLLVHASLFGGAWGARARQVIDDHR